MSATESKIKIEYVATETNFQDGDVTIVDQEYITDIKEEYVVDEDDDIKITEDEKEVDESSLEMNVNAWPISILFQTVSEEDVDNGNKACDTENRESSDSTEDDRESLMSISMSSVDNDNCSDVSIDISVNRKRKKVLKMRKPKRQSNVLKCNTCSIRYHTQSEMNMHLYTVHKIGNNFYVNNKFACRLCKRLFNSKLYLEAHITQMHTEKRVINCIKCKKVFKYRSYLTTKQCDEIKTDPNSDLPTYKRFTCFHCNLKRT